jgi:hypothetical protein
VVCGPAPLNGMAFYGLCVAGLGLTMLGVANWLDQPLADRRLSMKSWFPALIGILVAGAILAAVAALAWWETARLARATADVITHSSDQ